MAVLNFPASPTVGQIYTANDRTFEWDGTSWNNKTTFSTNVTNDDTSAGPYYPMMAAVSSGAVPTAYVSNEDLYFNPNTGTLNSVTFNSLSDINYKTNVQQVENAIDILTQINGVSFNWIQSGSKSYGVIAQDLQKVLPELVEGTDKVTVNYSGLVPFLIEAVKELSEKVEQLEQNSNK